MFCSIELEEGKIRGTLVNKNQKTVLFDSHRTFYSERLPVEKNTDANIQRCICAHCAFRDIYQYGDTKCRNPDECARLRQVNVRGLFEPKHTSVAMISSKRAEVLERAIEGTLI